MPGLQLHGELTQSLFAQRIEERVRSAAVAAASTSSSSRKSSVASECLGY